MNTELENELRAWLRPVSPLTAYVKSLRMEGAGGSQSSDPSKAEIVDHFQGIDLDELPDGIREKVQAAREGFVTLQKNVTDSEERRTKAEEFARTQQSRADKLDSVVRKHNLPIDGQQQTQQSVPDDRINAAAKRFEAQGLKPDAALVYAKMFESERDVMEKEILAKVAPLAGNIQDLEARQALDQVQEQFSDTLAIPAVKEQVDAGIKALRDQGRSINSATVEHLVDMAYGKYLRLNPDAKATVKTETKIPQFKGGVSGGHVNAPGKTEDGKLIAREAETTKIIDAINKEFSFGMKKGTK